MADILIIEDDPQVRKLLSLILSKQGYEVVVAENGSEGLSVFKTEQVPIVITDLVMPEKEGIETIIDLRTISATVKIVAISGGGRTSNHSYLNTAKELGADLTLEKPVDQTKLLETIRIWME